MTRAQHRVFNRLRHKQVNANDVAVVEVSDGAVTFFVTFPGLYLTYDNTGGLLEVETVTEREQHVRRLVGNAAPEGEMGSDAIPK